MDASPPRTNFDLLRVVAVGIVVYGNGLVLTGAAPSALWGAPMPRIGLDLLFAISGYLAAGSWQRRPRVAVYAAGRALRLFPGLIACVLVTVFVIGPLATRLPLRAYLLNGMTRRYFGNALLLPQLWLPRVFEGQQWVGTVNPMLWTLLPGAVCWAAVPLVAATRRPALAAGSAALLCAVASLLWPALLPHLPHAFGRPVMGDALVEAPFFGVAGALGFAERERGAGLFRADLAMLCFAANWMMATWLDEWTLVLEWLTVPYMAVCFGRMRLPGLGRFGAAGNPSYGAYLYAFPLQQLIVELLPGLPGAIPACFVAALLAGYLSWHLVEQPALRRGRRAWRFAVSPRTVS